MKTSQIKGPELVQALFNAGKLDANQVAAFNAKKLKAVRAEYYHRAKIANTGTLNGVSLVDLDLTPQYGLTNLTQQAKLPNDFVLIGMRAAVAVYSGLVANIAPSDLKVGSYDNLVLDLGTTTKRIIDPIKNSFFRLEIGGKKETEFAAKNFFLQGNSKQYIESDDQDLVLMPDGMKVYSKDTDVRPTLLLPQGVALSTPEIGVGSKQYAWETTLVGFNLVIEG